MEWFLTDYFCLQQDGGNPPLESETTVIVDVTDVSDNPPNFLRPIYLEQISENKPKVRISVGGVGVNIQVSRAD